MLWRPLLCHAWVLEITGDCHGVICLLKVYIVVPVICLYFPIVNTAVDVPVTGVSDAGNFYPCPHFCTGSKGVSSGFRF